DKGLLAAGAARSLSDEEVLAFIFSPGFSTSGAVTRVSGRGVGMDAARVRIEALGGSLKVESTAGKGARFRVRVPLTLAIIRALRVRAGQEHYMVPVANVAEAVECSRDEIITHEGAPAMLLRGEPLLLRRLDELLGCPGSAWAPLFTVLVAESGDAHAGLAVDEVLGQQEIAIKSLGRSLKSVRGFGGVTILGDGSVRLILDLPSLLGL
ncbi:MAG: chemotaxis protein CheW, partial [bacterium]